MLEIKNLYKSYDRPIISDFSLKVDAGETLIISGASGIGKTTLIKLIAGLEKADKGSISFSGHLRIMFQENRLLPNINAIKNISAVLKKGEADIEEIKKQLKSVGLDEQDILKSASSLSGGQKRRVALIRAFMPKSDLIILDEPFTGLDDASKELAADFILKNKNQRSLIIISHDIPDKLCAGAKFIELK